MKIDPNTTLNLGQATNPKCLLALHVLWRDNLISNPFFSDYNCLMDIIPCIKILLILRSELLIHFLFAIHSKLNRIGTFSINPERFLPTWNHLYPVNLITNRISKPLTISLVRNVTDLSFARIHISWPTILVYTHPKNLDEHTPISQRKSIYLSIFHWYNCKILERL